MGSIVGILPLLGNDVDFRDDLSTGKAQLLFGFGSRSNISNASTGDDVWTGTAAVLPIPPDVGEQMTVVSSSVQDGVGGTGILTLGIRYVDAVGVVKEEVITMNGTTPVNTVATNIRFVQELHTKTAGSNNLSVGTVIIYKLGSATTIYNQIEPNTNQSLCSARMVPAGKICLLWGFHCSAGGGKAADVRIRATSHKGTLFSRLFHFKDNAMLLDNGAERVYRTPRVFPPFTIIKVTAYAVSAVGGANIQASWEGILLDTPIT